MILPAHPPALNGTRRSPPRGVSDGIAGSPEVHVDVGVAAHVSARVTVPAPGTRRVDTAGLQGLVRRTVPRRNTCRAPRCEPVLHAVLSSSLGHSLYGVLLLKKVYVGRSCSKT